MHRRTEQLRLMSSFARCFTKYMLQAPPYAEKDKKHFGREQIIYRNNTKWEVSGGQKLSRQHQVKENSFEISSLFRVKIPKLVQSQQISGLQAQEVMSTMCLMVNQQTQGPIVVAVRLPRTNVQLITERKAVSTRFHDVWQELGIQHLRHALYERNRSS